MEIKLLETNKIKMSTNLNSSYRGKNYVVLAEKPLSR